MFSSQQYRPPGRSNRSGRSNADNDVFEGLPVKQWGQSLSRVSLAPPVMEVQNRADDKWADPPMPRDYQMLQPFTQQLLRLARSGRVGTKRKQDHDIADEDKPEDEQPEEPSKDANIEDRGYVARKWKPVPEHQLEPEHKHFEFLAKRRKGLPSLYGPDQQVGAPIVMRKTKVQKADANGEVAVYEVLVPEGQTMEGEVTESTELADVTPIVAAPGTVIEGVGIANEEGVVVAEHLKPTVARRNRPPPKKKGGPGRGKKRVTFTNPDGSTYTTVVPNATKIVPQPGQTVKHVAKGEEAGADVTAAQAAAAAPEDGDGGEGGEDDGEDGSGSDEGDDDDDDDREDGELSDEEMKDNGAETPAAPTQNHDIPGDQNPVKDDTAPTTNDLPENNEDRADADVPTEAETSEKVDASEPMEDVQHEEVEPIVKAMDEEVAKVEEVLQESQSEPPAEEEAPQTPHAPAHALADANRDPSSSPDQPLATSKSRSASLAEPTAVSLEDAVPPPESKDVPATDDATPIIDDLAPPASDQAPATSEAPVADETAEPTDATKPSESTQEEPVAAEEVEKPDDAGDDDLLGNLERHLGDG